MAQKLYKVYEQKQFVAQLFGLLHGSFTAVEIFSINMQIHYKNNI